MSIKFRMTLTCTVVGQRLGKRGHVFVMTNEMALKDKIALVKQKSAYPP
jgi:hypothetical protein